jgi:hypothetical protein
MLGRIALSRTLATAAAPAAVWAAYEAAPRWPQVLTDLLSARIVPDGVLAAGSTIHVVARPGTRAADMTYRVVAASPPVSLALESEAMDFRARTEYAIAANGAGSSVTVHCRIEPVRWLHRLTTALARRYYRDQLATMIETRTRAMLTLAERI